MVTRFPFFLMVLPLLCCLLCAVPFSPVYGMEIVPDTSKHSEQVVGGSLSSAGELLFASQAIDGPVTVISTLVFGADWDFDTEAEMWLVGLSRAAGEASLGLGVTWSEVDAGWFPFWRIQVQSQQGDQVECLDLAIVTPEAEHSYTSTLSYDPTTGGGALHIIDETTGKLVYSGGFAVKMQASLLFPVAGVARAPAGVAVGVVGLDVYSTYVPVGAKLELAPESKPAVSLIGTFERTEALLIHLTSPGALPDGEYRIRAANHDTGISSELGPIRATAAQMSLPYPLLELPGQATLTLEYLSDGHRWFSHTSELSVGWLRADFANVSVDRQEHEISIEMKLQSDAVLQSVPLKVTATLARAARDQQTKKLQTTKYPPVVLLDDRLDVGSEPSRQLLSVALPDGPSTGVWQMTLHVESESSIDLRRFGMEARFAVSPSTADVFTNVGRVVDDRPRQISLDEEGRLRAEARARSRRIIFNNDGDDARTLSAPRTMETFLNTRTTPLLGSQVDTIIYDTTAGTFGGFSHATQIGQAFINQEGVFRNNLTADLIMRGTDPLQMTVDFARANGIEVFWAMRMNDTHDSYTEPMFSDFKKENPDLLFGSSTRRPQYGAWSGADYGDPRVRELAFRYIEEVAENYDVDGVFLDFFRHSVFFKRVAWGEAISETELNAMTGLLRRIRERLRELGAIRGRPFLLAARVPDSLEYCTAIGLDLERWLAEGLVDMFMPGGYFRLDRWETSVELGRRYGVPVYPSLDESRVGSLSNPGVMDPDRRTLEAYRGRAMNVWQAGAAGVHLFNMFTASHPMLQEIGSPETLVGKEKVYFVSIRGDSGAANPNSQVGEKRNFFRVPVVTPDSPRVLWSDAPTVVALDVGEDIEAARKLGLHPVITLQLHTAGLPQAEGLEVRLNGHLLDQPQVGSSYLEYAIDPAWLCQGSNRLELWAHHESQQASHSVWAGPLATSNALAITGLDVTRPDPRSLRLRIRAEATGEAVVGSVLIRPPNKGDVDPIPPGFDVTYGGYRLPKGWSAPGFRFNGPFDEEADDENVFAITLPMAGAKPDEYALRVYVTNRPALGTYYDDSRLVLFRIDDQGTVQLPGWHLYDVQLRVRYTK